MNYVYRVRCEGTVASRVCKGCADDIAADVAADYPELEVDVELDPDFQHTPRAVLCTSCGNEIRPA